MYLHSNSLSILKHCPCVKWKWIKAKHHHGNIIFSINIHGECVYLIGPDERLHSQVILHQFLHVGLSSYQWGELRSCRQTQRRLVGGAGRSTCIGVPEKHIPGLRGQEEGSIEEDEIQRQEKGLFFTWTVLVSSLWYKYHINSCPD